MKNLIFICLWALFSVTALAKTTKPLAGDYTMVVEGFDWGAAVSKVILATGENQSEVKADDFHVYVKRSSDCGEIRTKEGKRTILHAYASDARGNKAEDGKFVTLVLFVAPFEPISSPINYFPQGNCRGNQWIDYQMIIANLKSGEIWNQEKGRIIPLIDEFDLSGKFTHDETTLPFASYTPDSDAENLPLIIWLHGGGEGGTDPSIPLIANRAANYASPEIQAYFGGAAYVLVPQSPSFWMDNGEGGYTRGNVNDRYNEALMALIRDYVAKHPNVDQSRIYLGGCSNGGYMTLKLILEHPDYFAAGFPSALAYHSEFLSDKQIKRIKHVPIWFIQSKDDPVTVPDKTAVSVYERLKKAGAKNVYFSYFDHVVDITGLFGGEQYHYNGHWSWIYSHANKCQLDYDGTPVKLNGKPTTLMGWLAAQKLAK